MTRLFWRLNCKYQTQLAPCISVFNANPEHEAAVLADLDTYVRRYQ